MAPSTNHLSLPELTSPLGITLVCFSVIAALVFIDQVLLALPYPKGVELAGGLPGARRFNLRTRLAYYRDCETLFKESWEKYSKRGKAVILPGLGFRSEIILPPDLYKWAHSQPESVLSTYHAHAETDLLPYTLGDDKYVADPWQGHLVKNELSPALDEFVGPMYDEVKVVFDACLGNNPGEWVEVDLRDLVRRVVGQVASRFQVGLTLCRDQAYIQNCLEISQSLVNAAGITGGLPRVLQPILGYAIGWDTRRKMALFKKQWEPTYRARLAIVLSNNPPNPDTEPRDFLQMMMRHAQQYRPDDLHDFDAMTARLMISNFGSMHMTAVQTMNMLLNIIGSNAEHNTISTLRDEFKRVGGGDQWTKARIAKMVRTDSVARETLRLHQFGGRGGFKKVMVDGFTLPNGVMVPRGTMLTWFTYPMQTDEAIYGPDARAYDPFRFSRMREEEERNEKARMKVKTKANEDGAKALLSFVSTSATAFMPFGHGKHACPGRFLADFEFKMILEYLFTRYDVEFPEEYQGKRPPNVWVAEALFPPTGARIRARRRKSEAI
ncbi:cytochrome P450 [Podospora didyma]|uniref:Cytochrome P450 n=1 Tax=Podospora didyma TaxID=330526 RepID=A0AAE0NPW9_9PEZI|nr:cytochrome P450 [Podospora didyma]